MFVLNKIVGTVLSPLGLLIIVLFCAGAWTLWRRQWKACAITMLASSVCLWVWGTGAWIRVIGLPLERGWHQQIAEDLPVADAIVLLGGGMSANTAVYPYPDMHSGADRVWHAARLYKAGKAPIIIPSGNNDRESTVPLLIDLGVPEKAVVGEYKSRNTEENAKFVAELLAGRKKEPGESSQKRLRILLVTSAWHMRRSILMYTKYAGELEIIPAPADFELTVMLDRPLELRDFFPSADAFLWNGYIVKELVGYWGYKLLR